ncbi:Mss4-like protein [Paraphoma chrysanthemicola]|uniref:Mss4-like protein n=1 Tax=Paraphoma chrysanthemicola TaxID=798071 RepID=A0A8K0VWQ0_9PLEO|nr:Mss4-like protein [Paraphoma chrysanthemicola]
MVEGRCNCSGIKVSLAELPKQYSSNCRRAGSTVGAFIYVIDKDQVKIDDQKGYLKTYQDSDTKSGNTILRKFCSNCGSPIASLISEEAPQMYLKCGLFEEIPVATYKAFEDEEPAWFKISQPNL